ncbi:MAG: N-6 DNA methylase [Peptococcaceae bacterium]|nr:N-6 DNA methylase [Peptococcaceae bacterium]
MKTTQGLILCECGAYDTIKSLQATVNITAKKEGIAVASEILESIGQNTEAYSRYHLNEIIARLGYSGSPCLKRRSNNYDPPTLTAHNVKVLNALSPFAAYMVNAKPFVLFFDEPSNRDEQIDLNKKIWNAQIPVTIFCGAAAIKIFNGRTIDKKTHLLSEAEEIHFNEIDEINENSPFSFWEITSQNFWKSYTQQFSGQQLNEALLDNLTFLTDRLKNACQVPFATKLVLRLIFIRYLIDRGVNLDYSGFSSDVAASREALLTLLNDRSNLYAFFSHLKDKLNGNLFEFDDESLERLTEPALGEIKDFLSANISTQSGQLSLFDLYDFNIIPVELISNIYEILLGKELQSQSNTFYTPKYLADYILDVTIDEYIEENETCRILDPSCGSGAFLVDSYRRMIEKKLKGKLYTEDDAFLCNTLTDNIYGIDLNRDAVDVAIFSLYLAVLDYKNPKTLIKFRLPLLKGKNLLVCDFFDEEELAFLQDVSFDFIIGNPPWGSNQGKHVDYCINHGYKQYLQSNDTCRSFIMRSKDFCVKNKNAKCCFVLHSKTLYLQKQPSKRFREFLLTNTKLIRVIELSSVRKLVFKNADAPAIVLSYSFSDENTLENRFEHISMKKNRFFHLFNIIVVEKTDVKSVQQKLLMENDWAWKTMVYGLTGDIDTIMRLKSAYPTLEKYIKSQSPMIIEGRGVEYNDGSKSAMLDAQHLLARPLLKSRGAIHHFILNENFEDFRKKRVHRVSNKALFYAPYCLVMKGADTADYTMKAVYSETDFVFRDTVWALKGSLEQKDSLLNITGLINSKAYAYLNLMLGSSTGIEREQRLQEEILNFPFVFSEDIAKQVEQIQRIKKQEGQFVVSADTSDDIDKLNQTILDAFGLSGNEFVDYALRIQIPQLTGASDGDANREVTIQDFNLYGKYFYNYLSEIFANSGKHIQIQIYPIIAKHYCAFEVVLLNEKPVEWLIIIDGNGGNQKAMLANLSAHKTNELFYSLRNVLYFGENSFYIIKPSYYKNWHPAIVRLDLMEVTDQILSRNNGGKNQ